MMFGVAYVVSSTPRSRSKRSIALINPIAPIWTRSSNCSPRYEYRRASERTSDMYCSISCSRAARSPCSWYRRRRSLSLSAIAAPAAHRDPLRQADRVAVDVNVVDGGLEHAPQAQLVVGLSFDLVQHARVERPDPRDERAVAHGHAHGDVAGFQLA